MLMMATTNMTTMTNIDDGNYNSDENDEYDNEYVEDPNALKTADGKLATRWRRPFLVTQLDVQVGEVEHLDNDKIKDTN